jgi:hypothetical protein
MLSGMVRIRERDAGIAAGRLDQSAPGFQLARFFEMLDHRETDAVLDRGERVEELALPEDLGLHILGLGELG